MQNPLSCRFFPLFSLSFPHSVPQGHPLLVRRQERVRLLPGLFQPHVRLQGNNNNNGDSKKQSNVSSLGLIVAPEKERRLSSFCRFFFIDSSSNDSLSHES